MQVYANAKRQVSKGVKANVNEQALQPVTILLVNRMLMPRLVKKDYYRFNLLANLLLKFAI